MIETTNLNKKRITEYLSEGKRFDSRKLDEYRDIVIEKDISKNAEGSVLVKLGNTQVMVGVKMDTSTPYADSPTKGNLMVSADLLPLSSPRFEAGPPKFDVIELGRVIDRGIRESGFIEFDKLCIKEGEKVWTIFVDIYSINDDGNLLDAAGIGAIVALKNAKIPKYDEENEKVLYGELSDVNVPLSDKIPIALTVHKIGENLLVDPTREEEDISETRVTIGSSNGKISSMQKGKEQSLKVEEMNTILDIVEKVERDVYNKIEKYI